MYKLNSGFRWTTSAAVKTEVMSLRLISDEKDADIQQLEQQHHYDKIIKSADEKLLENILSNLLKYGVLTASFVVLFGGILYLINHGSEPVQYQIFHGTSPLFCSPIGVIQAIASGSKRGIIQLGLLILIAVPILRVIISCCIFALQRQFIYVFITLFVLVSLTYSLLGAYY